MSTELPQYVLVGLLTGYKVVPYFFLVIAFSFESIHSF